MQLNVLSGSTVVQSLEALQALVDTQRHRIVTALMGESLTAKEISERLGIGRTRLYYHLSLLEEHGLIQVVDTRVVRGIQEKRYRAAARTFRIDRALLASRTSETEVAQVQASIFDAVAADLHARAVSSAPSCESDLLVSRTFLKLNFQRRTELRSRLEALVRDFRDADSDGVETELALGMFTTVNAS